MHEDVNNTFNQNIENQVTRPDFMKGYIIRAFRGEEQDKRSQQAAYVKENGVPYIDDTLKLAAHDTTNKFPPGMKIQKAQEIFGSVDHSLLSPLSKNATGVPLADALRLQYQGNKTLRDQIAAALDASKRAQKAQGQALSKLLLRVIDLKIYHDENIDERKAKIDSSVADFKNLLEGFDRLYIIERSQKDPERQKFFDNLSKYDITDEDRQSSLEVREIQLGYEVAKKVMDKLQHSAETEKDDINYTKGVLMSYAENTGIIRAQEIAKGERGNEQKYVDELREQGLAVYEKFLREAYLE